MKYDINKYPIGSVARVKEQLRNNDMNKALKTINDGNIHIELVKEELDSCIEWLYTHKAFGVILSAYYKFGNCSKYSVSHLLRKMYEIEDYPSFLKQAYRFDAYNGFVDEIEVAIKWHKDRNLPDFKSWEYKFTKLYEIALLQSNEISNEEIEVLEELETNELGKIEPYILEIRPIKQNTIKKIVSLEDENDPYIISRVARHKMESANKRHQMTVMALKDYLSYRKLDPVETKLIDTFCVLNSGPAIFEIKSITAKNEREQIRHAISQLYEYKYLHMLPDASLWIVFSEMPFSKWYIDYLLNDRNINVIWYENNSFSGPSINDIK